MNIAIVTNYYPDEIGGAETALHRLASHWHRMGDNVTLFAGRGRKRIPRYDWQPQYNYIPIRRPYSTRIGLGSYARTLLKRHRRQQFDVLLASDCYWAGHVANLVWQQSKLPFVIWSHGTDISIPRFRDRPLCHSRMQQTLANARALIVVSEHLRKLFEQHFGPLSTPVHVIGNGWPDDWATQPPPPRPIGPRYILAIGRLVQQKGFHILLAAYEQLARRRADVALVIAGDGPYREHLVKQVKATGLPLIEATSAMDPPLPCVVLTGMADDHAKWALHSHAEVSVCPSLQRESHGIVIQEAFACGVPVIGSNLDAIPELVHDGVNGRLFPPGDVSCLAAQLEQVIESPKLRADLATGTRPTVATSCWSHVATQHLMVLQTAAEQRHHA